MFVGVAKWEEKQSSHAVSSHFLNHVKQLFNEIPKEAIKTYGVVRRLMSILRNVKHNGSVDHYVTCLVEAARMASKLFARVNYELEDKFS